MAAANAQIASKPEKKAAKKNLAPESGSMPGSGGMLGSDGMSGFGGQITYRQSK